MRQYQKILAANDIYSYRRYLQQMLVMAGVLIFSLDSGSALAATCDIGFENDSFSIADYNKLAPVESPPSLKIDQIINGAGNESYLSASNSWALNGSLTPNGTNTYQSTNVAGAQVFQLFQDYADRTSFRTVSYTFKNKFTQQAQPLNKLSLSIYDIDTSIAGSSQGTRYFRWFDQVTINGFTSTGSLVTPFIEFKGPGITSNAPYRQNTVTSAVACSGLDDNCKVSVAFTDPVVRVDVVYGNDPALNYSSNNLTNNDPSSQIINIKFDSYCYKPQPRLTYNKELSDPRRASTDQFTVQIKDNMDNSVVTSNITTTTTKGNGNTITTGTGTTGMFKIDPTKTYTLTEAASGTTTLSNYMPTYTCRKSGPNGAIITTLNPNNLQLTYGDDWTCTVRNSLRPYTFTGFVFNDNGGIARSTNPDTKSDFSTTFTNNSKYFNSVFDSGETGIGNTTGLSMSLTNCNGVNIGGTTSQTISDNPLGQYKFIVPASVIAALNPQKVCIVQVEPNSWIYSVDTTPNNRSVDLQSGKFDYKTEGSVNLDFGEAEADYAALVLRKAQFVNNCPSTLDYSASILNTPGNTDPRNGFSESGISGSDLVPGQCIAYRIQAYNRGHINLQSIQIKDELQVTPVKSVFHLPFPVGLPNNINNNSNRLPNSEIMSNQFNLEAAPLSGNAPKATLYFNTKYGTTIDP